MPSGLPRNAGRTTTARLSQPGRGCATATPDSGSEDEEDRLLRRPKGGKGFLAMDDAWFSEYVYEVVVPRSLVPPEILERSALREPVPLPLWDTMGSVAR